MFPAREGFLQGGKFPADAARDCPGPSSKGMAERVSGLHSPRP